MIRFIKNSIIRLSRHPYKIKKTLPQKQSLIERLFMITYEAMRATAHFVGEDVCFRLYADNVNEIFARAPKAAGTSEAYAILPFKYGLQDYLYRLYPLFRRIVIAGALPDLSPYIARLIKYYKGHYLLTNSDIESLDYKFALLACFTLPTNYNP